MNELRRALAFMRAVEDRSAARIVLFRSGKALFHHRLPNVWDLNFLRVERARGCTAVELTQEAERLQRAAGLKHRRVVVDGEAEGARLAPEFEALGWSVDRFVVMAHRRSPHRAVELGHVDEVGEAALRDARERGMRAEPWGSDPETVRQLLEAKQVIASAVSVRHFAAHVAGTFASYCELYSDGRTGQIEDVATLEKYRGRGLASAVVLKALEASVDAGNDLTFLVADDKGWPKELYAKLGFDAVGLIYSFRKSGSPRASDSASQGSPKRP